MTKPNHQGKAGGREKVYGYGHKSPTDSKFMDFMESQGHKVVDAKPMQKNSNLGKPTPTIDEWEKEFDKLIEGTCWNPHCTKNADCQKDRKEVKDFIRSLLHSNREEVIREIKEWVSKENDDYVVVGDIAYISSMDLFDFLAKLHWDEAKLQYEK